MADCKYLQRALMPDNDVTSDINLIEYMIK